MKISTLFMLGITGIILNKKNLITTLISIEIMLLAVNLNFIKYSILLDDILGQVFALFVLTVAAAEAAIGLSLLVVYYRLRGTILINVIPMLGGA